MAKNTPTPTLEEHVEIGRLIKVHRNAIREILGYSKYFRTADTDRLLKLLNLGPVDRLKSDLEERMLEDFPWLTDDALSVYYHDDEEVTAERL